jgi:hypothetical protein
MTNYITLMMAHLELDRKHVTMQEHVGSIISNRANVYYCIETIQNEIVFVMMTCVQSTPSFPTSKGKATGT